MAPFVVFCCVCSLRCDDSESINASFTSSQLKKADGKRRAEMRMRNSSYAKELSTQMAIQEERKVLEPYLMSKAERQMNAALLRKLPTD